MITLNEAKEYLRVDTADEDAFISALIVSAERICADVARLSDEQWIAVNSDEPSSPDFSEVQLAGIRSVLRIGILYAIGYLFEHREEADHHDLVMTLRNLLFSIREGVF